MASVSFSVNTKRGSGKRLSDILEGSSLGMIAESARKHATYELKIGVTKESNVVVDDKGTTTAHVARYIEYGWTQTVTSKQARYLSRASGGFYQGGEGGVLYLPPRPFLRDTFEQNHRKWSRMFSDYITKGKRSIEYALNKVGERAVKDIHQTLLWKRYQQHSELTMAIARTEGRYLPKVFRLDANSALYRSISYKIEVK